MSKEFRFQDPGEGIHEAEIVEIHVSEGDVVEEGDTVLTVETDKALTELSSPFAGEVAHIAVKAGGHVEVGDLLMSFGGDGATEAGEDGGADADEDPREGRSDGADSDESSPDGDGDGGEARQSEAGDAADPRLETDTGAKGDESSDEAPERPAPEHESVPASPATRRRARELDVDLTEVEGSGPHGRVTTEDVERTAEDAEPAQAPNGETQPADEEASIADRAERWGPVERIPLRGIRRTTARRMVQSWTTIPQVTHHDLADITDLERLRRRRVDDIDDGDLTLLIVVMKAVAAALGRFPRFNASIDPDGDGLVLKQYVHIGIAVDTDEGLMVPVVRDVDRHSIRDLAATVTDLVERARSREIEREEMQGASFTITNPGPLGGRTFTPIINPPEVAILGMGRARLDHVVSGDLDDHETRVRLVLPLSLAFDHRAVDGADSARFISALIEMLGDPEHLILDL